MEKLEIRTIELGSGVAKICVPIVSSTQADIIEEVKAIASSQADIIEWRCDFYEDYKDIKKVVETLKLISIEAKEKPLIFTFRTTNEGGEADLSIPEYLLLYKTVILSKRVDIVDVQLLIGDTVIKNIVKHAEVLNTKVILSNHDMNSTPSLEKIMKRLLIMKERGADISKVAYQPNSEVDVENVIKAVEGVKDQIPFLIAISMGELGKKTRTNATEIGSCITFAALKKESAPGQLNVEELYVELHK